MPFVPPHVLTPDVRRPASRRDLRLAVVPTTLEDSRANWTALARRQDNVFGTWEWAWAWWETYGRGRRALIHEVRADGEPIGILPLYAAMERPGRLLRFIGHGPGDQLAPVCAAPHREVVTAALRSLAGELAGPRGLLLAESLRGDEGWNAALHGSHVRRQSSPLIDLDGLSWEGWLARKSSNFRQTARRRERRLEQAHRLRYRIVRDEDERAWALGVLVELHRASWGEASTTFDPGHLRLHERFSRLAAERGWLRLWVAELEGRPAAAWLGYRFGGVDAYYQMGRDPARNDMNVGSVLLLRTIRDALDARSREYRMLRGGEEYKRRLQSSDPGVDTYLVGAGPLPALAAGLLRRKRWVPASARRAFVRRLGR